MPRKRDPGPGVKDKDTYEALRDDGASKEKAARIANARAAGTLDSGGSKPEDRSKTDLYEEAKDIGVEGRSKMTKKELVDAIRHN